MKKTSWLAGCGVVLGVLVATGAFAQANSNALPTIPPPATATSVAAPAIPAPAPETVTTSTNAPAKKAVGKHLNNKKAKKHVAKKAKATKAKPTAKVDATLAAAAAATNLAPAITLVPGDATVTAEHVNVRGQAGLRGEVVAHLKKGDHVNILAAITLDKHKADEPAEWAKISLPADTKVWLDGDFVDAATKAVKAKKLNLRGGPGENYSVLGFVEAGTVVAPAVTKGNWWQIDTPTNAYAFVAASYLSQSAPEASVAAAQPSVPAAVTETPAAPATNAAPAAPEPPTTTNTVTDTSAIVAAPPTTTPVDTNSPAVTAPTPTNNVAAILANESAAAAAAAAATNATTEVTDTNPPPPRIVTHEGVVRPVSSIIAPTYFELDDPASGKAINYLFTTSTNLDLNRYNKLHIIVTGEEGLAQRWRKTPVLTIQRIQVIE